MDGLEIGALYAVLYYRNDATSWHWSLFLPDPSVIPIGKDGTSFQVSDTIAADSTVRWHYERTPENVVESLRTVLCVKLGDVQLLGNYFDAVEWLHNTLKAVPITPKVFVDTFDRQQFTCRTWFLAAVADLHDLGILSCHNVTMLEQEIKNRAVLATMSFVDWGGTTVCTSKHCS